MFVLVDFQDENLEDEIAFYKQVVGEPCPVENFLDMMTHKNFYENIENWCWTEGVYDRWSPGGCPPPTD